jgi:hypothetical protein
VLTGNVTVMTVSPTPASRGRGAVARSDAAHAFGVPGLLVEGSRAPPSIPSVADEALRGALARRRKGGAQQRLGRSGSKFCTRARRHHGRRTPER